MRRQKKKTLATFTAPADIPIAGMLPMIFPSFLRLWHSCLMDGKVVNHDVPDAMKDLSFRVISRFQELYVKREINAWAASLGICLFFAGPEGIGRTLIEEGFIASTTLQELDLAEAQLLDEGIAVRLENCGLKLALPS